MEEDSAVYSASTIRRLMVEDGGFEWGELERRPVCNATVSNVSIK